MKNLKNGDIVFKRGKKGLFTRLIKWFTRTKGEKRTIATHVGMIIWIDGKCYVIEALWRVTLTPIKEWMKKHKHYSIWRMKGLTSYERAKLRDRSLKYLNNFYGFFKLFLHAIDLAISKVIEKEIFLFRRLQYIDDYPICNWLVAYTYYDVLKYSFGISPKLTDPDSMNDYVRDSEDFKLMIVNTGEVLWKTEKSMIKKLV